jgi:lysophospholipase L1-like esterase
MSNLVFIGDSLTQWCNWEKCFPSHAITNLGISGETVEGLLARRERIRSQIASPDFIFLMTGINNIANEMYDFLVPYREIVRNLTTWYKRSTVVVQSILPIDITWIDNNTISRTNRELERIASEFNAAYLDIYSLFVNGEGKPRAGYLTDDGVHLANKGYDVWAEAVGKFLASRKE